MHGYNNPIYNVHETWVPIIHGRIWSILTYMESSLIHKRIWQTLSMKGQIVNIPGFAGRRASLEFWRSYSPCNHCSSKAALDCMSASGQSCVLTKLYLPKHVKAPEAVVC